MADEKKTETKAAPSKSPASESGDPAVHQLLAEQDIARRNGDDEKVKEASKKLADLGFAG
jgi:hypothetical protein